MTARDMVPQPVARLITDLVNPQANDIKIPQSLFTGFAGFCCREWLCSLSSTAQKHFRAVEETPGLR